jgi:hypothetical protein
VARSMPMVSFTVNLSLYWTGHTANLSLGLRRAETRRDGGRVMRQVFKGAPLEGCPDG